MKFVKVKLIKSWGHNNYYKTGNVVYVSEDVAVMMTKGKDKYGYLVDNDNEDLLDAYHASNEEE